MLAISFFKDAHFSAAAVRHAVIFSLFLMCCPRRWTSPDLGRRPSLIAGVIVTHCHADHDAGTFQKVLLDGQVNIISTRLGNSYGNVNPRATPVDQTDEDEWDTADGGWGTHGANLAYTTRSLLVVEHTVDVGTKGIS